jgi:HSP20 family protein
MDFWEEIAALERRMDDLVRGFLGTRTRLAYPALPLFVRKPHVPRMDVFERGDDLVLKAELPGIDAAKDLTVETRDGTLVIKGERRQEKEIEEDAYYRMEASYGSFERQLEVPEGVDEKEIVARYADGILEIVFPHGAAKAPEEEEESEAVKARKVPVTIGTKPAKAA